MKYENITKGKFISRPNRFKAYVELNGEEEVVHVKNTGRCAELLKAGACVYVQESLLQVWRLIMCREVRR